MAALRDRLREELIASRKAQQKPLTLLLGTILADIENHHISVRRDLTDEDVIDVLRKGIKRRKESVEAYETAGRTELAAQERNEVAMLERFLPPSISDDEIRAAVRTVIADGATNIGGVMEKSCPSSRAGRKAAPSAGSSERSWARRRDPENRWSTEPERAIPIARSGFFTPCMCSISRACSISSRDTPPRPRRGAGAGAGAYDRAGRHSRRARAGGCHALARDRRRRLECGSHSRPRAALSRLRIEGLS